MEKIFKETLVFELKSEKDILWKNIKHFSFEDNDIIVAHYEEPYYSEDNSYEGYNHIKIYRNILETDKEFKERVGEHNLTIENRKRDRYEQYLKLKKEFDV